MVTPLYNIHQKRTIFFFLKHFQEQLPLFKIEAWTTFKSSFSDVNQFLQAYHMHL